MFYQRISAVSFLSLFVILGALLLGQSDQARAAEAVSLEPGAYRAGELLLRLRSPDEPRLPKRPPDRRYRHFAEWTRRHRIVEQDIKPALAAAGPLQFRNLGRSLRRNNRRAEKAKVGSRTLRRMKLSRSELSAHSNNLFRVKLPTDLPVSEALAELAEMPNVVYAQPNFIYYAYQSDHHNEKYFDELWGHKLIEVPAAWELSEGQGVVVAVIDTGIDTEHPDLAANLWRNPGEKPGTCRDDDGNGYVDDIHGYDFSSESLNQADCPGTPVYPGVQDSYGHGTHVAGTIAAVRNGRGIIGVAPQAKIMALKGMDFSGSGYTVNMIKAIDYAHRNGARVINNSWGYSEFSFRDYALRDAIVRAHSAGSVVVFSAGNDGRHVHLASHLGTGLTLNVGAINSDRQRAAFSNSGSLIDIVAPGEEILSTYLPKIMIGGPGPRPGYHMMDGTSMAAPHVAGVAALVLGMNPDLSPQAVRSIIRDSAVDLGPIGFDTTFGHGLVNARAAVERAQALLTDPRQAPWIRLQSPGEVSLFAADRNVRGRLPVQVDFLPKSPSHLAVEYRPLLQSATPWTALAIRPVPLGSGEIAALNLWQVPLGYYLMRASARFDSMSLATSDVREFIVEVPGVKDLDWVDNYQYTGLMVDGYRVAWHRTVSRNERSDWRWRRKIVSVDLSTNSRRDYEILIHRALRDLTLKGEWVYYVNYESEVDLRGLEWHISHWVNLKRVNLKTDEHEYVDTCGRDAEAAGHCQIKIQPTSVSGRLLWTVVDSDGQRMVKWYHPRTGNTHVVWHDTVDDEEISAAWLGSSVLVVKSHRLNRTTTIFKVDALTGAREAIPSYESASQMFSKLVANGENEVLLVERQKLFALPDQNRLLRWRSSDPGPVEIRKGNFFDLAAASGSWLIMEVPFKPIPEGPYLRSTRALVVWDRSTDKERLLTVSRRIKSDFLASGQVVAWSEGTNEELETSIRAVVKPQASPSPTIS